MPTNGRKPCLVRILATTLAGTIALNKARAPESPRAQQQLPAHSCSRTALAASRISTRERRSSRSCCCRKEIVHLPTNVAVGSLAARARRRLRQRPEECPCPLAPARLRALRPVDDEERLLRVRVPRRLVKENLRPVPAARGLACRAVGVAQGAVVRGGRR